MLEKVVKVSLARRSYEIFVGSAILPTLGLKIKKILPRATRKVVVITNPKVFELYESTVTEGLRKADFEPYFLKVPEGEEYKTLQVASKLYDRLVELEADRLTPIVTLGGGVVGDLAGFVAATYMRGVPFIQVPTSLLAQVDSSVGGKVAVNHSQGKNLIGCFYQPNFVLADVDVLSTLPPREFQVGLAEVAKYGFINGDEFLSFFEANLSSIKDFGKEILIQIVLGSCGIKARVVEEDERDFGRRHILNYGHTIGHALEAYGEYGKYLHGEAIAIGMVGAALIAEELKLIGKDLVERHVSLFKQIGLPYNLSGEDIDFERIQEIIKLDKKKRGLSLMFVLLKSIGNPIVMEVEPKIVGKALEELKAIE